MIRRFAILFALAVFFAPAAGATGDAARTARRDAADYHALFEVREIVAPKVLRADGAGRCRARGVAHILFRGRATSRPDARPKSCFSAALAAGRGSTITRTPPRRSGSSSGSIVSRTC